MPKTNATIFIDSKDRPPTFAYDPPWNEFTNSRNQIFTLTYGHSVLIPMQTPEQANMTDMNNYATNGDFEFEGSALAFYGHVDPTVILNWTHLHTMESSIDGSPETSYQLFEDNEPHYENIVHRQWFSTPLLEYGTHILNLTLVPLRLTIDWFTVTPSETSNVKGKTLIIDDNDDTIRYTGAWTRDEGEQAYYRSMIVQAAPNRDVYRQAYGGGTHISRTVGDFVQIPFTGTSVKVVGLFPWKASGNLTLAIGTDYPNLETVSFPRVNEMPPIQEGVWDIDFEPDFLFYQSKSDLPEGDHILTINVTGISGGQSFILDSILYTASFESLATMSEIALPTIPFPPPPLPPKKTNVGALVGGVIGGVSALLALAWVAFFIRRRRRRNRLLEEKAAQPYITDEFLAKALPGSVVPETTPLMRVREKDRLNAAEGGLAGSARGAHLTNLHVSESAGAPSEADRRVQQLETQIQELERRNRDVHELQPGPHHDVHDLLPDYSEVNAGEIR